MFFPSLFFFLLCNYVKKPAFTPGPHFGNDLDMRPGEAEARCHSGNTSLPLQARFPDRPATRGTLRCHLRHASRGRHGDATKAPRRRTTTRGTLGARFVGKEASTLGARFVSPSVPIHPSLKLRLCGFGHASGTLARSVFSSGKAQATWRQKSYGPKS